MVKLQDHHSFKDKVVQNLKISRYDRVFKLLLRHSKNAREALIRVMKKEIKKDVRKAKIPSFQMPVDFYSFNNFSWRNALKELLNSLPLLTSFIQESLSKGIKRQLCKSNFYTNEFFFKFLEKKIIKCYMYLSID